MHNPFDLGYYNSEELRSFGFARIGECVQIAKTCKIFGLENITVGDNSRIDDFCTIIGTGPLVIGNRVHIHSYCQIGARGGVTFEDFSALASGCFRYTRQAMILSGATWLAGLPQLTARARRSRR